MAIVGTLSVEELKRAIAFEDAKEISRANGIGKKTAERIILELKDKIGHYDVDNASVRDISPEISGVSTDTRSEAVNALIALGYTKAEAYGAVAAVNEDCMSAEEYIKKALKNLF